MNTLLLTTLLTLSFGSLFGRCSASPPGPICEIPCPIGYELCPDTCACCRKHRQIPCNLFLTSFIWPLAIAPPCISASSAVCPEGLFRCVPISPVAIRTCDCCFRAYWSFQNARYFLNCFASCSRPQHLLCVTGSLPGQLCSLQSSQWHLYLLL